MKKILVVVDMQNDFVDGALGSKEAAAVVPAVAEKIRAFSGDKIFVTLDTHYENYPDTLEGRKLPVPHCISGTAGHRMNGEIEKALRGKPASVLEKKTFGTFAVMEKMKNGYPEEPLEIELCGLCTDICVISNALILRAAFPDAVMTVDARCCAGVGKDTHAAALAVMRCCQIDVIGEEEDAYHV